jgi:hypothetical protein
LDNFYTSKHLDLCEITCLMLQTSTSSTTPIDANLGLDIEEGEEEGGESSGSGVILMILTWRTIDNDEP